MWHRTLRSRLLASQLAVFGLFSLFAYVALDMALVRILMHRVDGELETHLLLLVDEFADLSEDNRARMQAHLTQFSYVSGTTETFFRILSEDGDAELTSDMSFWEEVTHKPLPGARIEHQPFVWETLRGVGRDGQDARVIYYLSPNRNLYQFGRSLSEVESVITNTRLGFALTLLVIMLVGGFVSYALTV